MQTSFMGQPIAGTRYVRASGALFDDGIVDVVKVLRALAGDHSVQLSGRERQAAVILGVRRGMTETAIGEALGLTKGFTSKSKRRHGIHAQPPPPREGGDIRVADRRGRRVAGGWKRCPMNEPLGLVYGTTNAGRGSRNGFEH